MGIVVLIKITMNHSRKGVCIETNVITIYPEYIQEQRYGKRVFYGGRTND